VIYAANTGGKCLLQDFQTLVGADKQDPMGTGRSLDIWLIYMVNIWLMIIMIIIIAGP
jgi:hypothetical protein